MAPRDRQDVRIFLRDASQQFRAAEKTFSRPPRRFEAGGMKIDRLRVYDNILLDRFLPDRHGHAARLQFLRKRVRARIAAAHMKPAIVQQKRQSAHAHAADPHKVTALSEQKTIERHTAFYAADIFFVTYFQEQLQKERIFLAKLLNLSEKYDNIVSKKGAGGQTL